MANGSSTAKPPSEWVEADILRLIADAVQESIDLDYKDSRSLLEKSNGQKRGISKDVSAFANAAGGTLVYGVTENGHVPNGIDGGVDSSDVSKEWLENVINSTTRPRIGGVRINQIALSSSPGRVLYVVDVPQSFTGAPHQANDHRYYKRFNFQSVPMEDYEVRDVMRRAMGPDLYCVVEIQSVDAVSCGFTFLVKLGNQSVEPALYAYVDIYLDDRVEDFFTPPGFEYEYAVSCTFGGLEKRCIHVRAPWVTPALPPLFKGVEHGFGFDRFGVRAAKYSHPLHMGVVLKAPQMEPKSTAFELWPKAEPNRQVVRLDDATFRVLSG